MAGNVAPIRGVGQGMTIASLAGCRGAIVLAVVATAPLAVVHLPRGSALGVRAPLVEAPDRFEVGAVGTLGSLRIEPEPIEPSARCRQLAAIQAATNCGILTPECFERRPADTLALIEAGCLSGVPSGASTATSTSKVGDQVHVAVHVEVHDHDHEYDHVDEDVYVF